MRIPNNHKFYINNSFVHQYRGSEPAWGPVGKVTFVRTYARELRGAELVEHLMRDYGYEENLAKQEARKKKVVVEEFWQTARRNIEFALTEFKHNILRDNRPWDDTKAQEMAQEFFRRYWAGKLSLPGRGVQFAGTPVVEAKGAAVLNNCGFRSTANIKDNFSGPFSDIMDFLMLGVGMGSDVQGAGTFTPFPNLHTTKHTVEDTREGWVHALRVLLDAYDPKIGTPMPDFDYSQIRKEGATLHTMGGTSSGYAPLKELLDDTKALLDNASKEGRCLNTTDIADIVNFIGRCVVSGNIRRSAEILLGQPTDNEFINLKNPDSALELYNQRAEVEKTVRTTKVLQDRVRRLNRKLNKDITPEVRRKVLAQLQTTQTKIQARYAASDEWQAITKQISEHPLNRHRWASNNTVVISATQKVPQSVIDKICANGEPGVLFLDNMRMYGRMSQEPDWADEKATGTNPCSEQTLEDGELCCLGELNPNAHTDMYDFLQSIKYIYLYCKAVTLVPTHNQRTNEIIARNRRIGLSMMGVFKMYEQKGMQECIQWWKEGYEAVRHWDNTYSAWLGCNRSIKVTSVKPGGSVPLLFGEEGGMKAPTANYYYRTIRFGNKSPLVKALAKAGYKVEKDLASPRTSVVYFPVYAGDGVRTASQVSMWEQMELLANLQAYWADNMVSNTITFQIHETNDIPKVLNAFAHRIKSVSFLPLATHGYAQAPYIPISKTEYETYKDSLKPINFSTAKHELDEKYCTGELCTVK